MYFNRFSGRCPHHHFRLACNGEGSTGEMRATDEGNDAD